MTASTTVVASTGTASIMSISVTTTTIRGCRLELLWVSSLRCWSAASSSVCQPTASEDATGDITKIKDIRLIKGHTLSNNHLCTHNHPSSTSTHTSSATSTRLIPTTFTQISTVLAKIQDNRSVYLLQDPQSISNTPTCKPIYRQILTA